MNYSDSRVVDPVEEVRAQQAEIDAEVAGIAQDREALERVRLDPDASAAALAGAIVIEIDRAVKGGYFGTLQQLLAYNGYRIELRSRPKKTHGLPTEGRRGQIPTRFIEQHLGPPPAREKRGRNA
jgi:hypothetical protein